MSAAKYQAALHSPSGERALTYLVEERGLKPETVVEFGLGYVEEPDEGHETARDFISIPYYTPRAIVGLRFRRGPDSTAPMKYYTLPGHQMRMFNTQVIHDTSDVVAICEGEMDAIIATQSGIPAVGIPGVHHWEPFYRGIFAGYEKVIILADQDDTKDESGKGPGQKFAETIAKQVPNPQVSMMPEGHDVNSFVLEFGAEALLEYVGVR